MVEVGRRNTLKVLHLTAFGAFLDGAELGEILLPNREMPEDCRPGSRVEVFLSYDSEDRLVATTTMPRIMVGEFALLKVVAVETVGAFLDWGLSKDLFLPFAEQSRTLRVGQEVIVYAYLDKSSRISASMRLERNADKTPGNYTEGQAVDLLVIGQTDLGFKALIQGRHIGVLYKNEVFQPLSYGQRIKGFIKKVRDDAKIDLSLQKPAADETGEIAEKILDLLEQEGGFAALTDKTPAEAIYKLFGVSKKKFKIALGGLYKKRVIRIDDEGIHLVASND